MEIYSARWKGLETNITRRDNTPACSGARDFHAAERSGGATIGRWPKNCMAPGPDGQQTQLVQKIERDKHPLTASQQRSSFRCTSLLLERISQSDLHNPWLTLNLREVVKVARRSQPVQAGIRGYSTIGETSQMLRVCYVEDIPTELQQVVFAVRHLPGFSQS